MSEITCAAIDCTHIGNDNYCCLNDITLNEHSIHTAHEGVGHFWTCKMYEKSEQTKMLERMFMKMIREDMV